MVKHSGGSLMIWAYFVKTGLGSLEVTEMSIKFG